MSKSKKSTTKLTNTPNKTRLIDEIGAEKPQYKRVSKVNHILGQLDEPDRSDFIAVLRNKSIPLVVIVRVMKRRGFDISTTSISNYRKDIYDVE